MMAEFLQFLISGLTVGAVYALVALGFTLIYNASDVVNFAQGEFVMLGGMVTVFAAAAGAPPPRAAGAGRGGGAGCGAAWWGAGPRPAARRCRWRPCWRCWPRWRPGCC